MVFDEFTNEGFSRRTHRFLGSKYIRVSSRIPRLSLDKGRQYGTTACYRYGSGRLWRDVIDLGDSARDPVVVCGASHKGNAFLVVLQIGFFEVHSIFDLE